MMNGGDEPAAQPVPAPLVSGQTESFVYQAFISYSTTTDYQSARKVEAFLEGLHQMLPRDTAELPQLQICRDGSDFRLPGKKSSSTGPSEEDAVWQIILSQLTQAKYLLVLCSAGAVKSRWVDREVQWMRQHRGDDFILLAVTGGDDPAGEPEECFPAAVREADLHQKKIWYDLREIGTHRPSVKMRNHEDELVRLAADLLGWSEEKQKPFAALWEREQLRRRRRQTRIAFAVALVLGVIALVAIWQALAARQAARTARANALVQLAETAFDPATGALLLSELAADEPAGGMRIALKLAATRLPQAILHRQTAYLTRVAFSPDQKHLLTSSRDGTVCIWPVEGGGDPVVLDGREGAIEAACFDPTGKLIATAAEKGAVRVWKWQDPGGSQLLAHPGSVTSVQFSGDSQWLLTEGDGAVRLWRIADATAQSFELPPPMQAARVWLDPQAVQGWVVTKDGTVWAFIVDAQGKLQLTRSPGQPEYADELDAPDWEEVAFSRDGSKVILANKETVVVKTCAGPQTVETLPHSKPAKSVALDRRGARAVTSAEDGKIRVWAGGQLEREIDSNLRYWSANQFDKAEETQNHALSFEQVAFSENDTQIVAVGGDSVVRLWGVNDSAPPIELRGHLGVHVLAFSKDGLLLATGADDGTARIWPWSIEGGPLTLKHPKQVYAAAFSPDGSSIVSSCADGQVRIWPMNPGGVPRSFPGMGENAPKIAFDRAFERLLCGHEDGRVRLWKIENPNGPEREFLGHTESIRGVRFSPDENQLLTWSEDGTVRLWKVDGTQPAQVFSANSGPIWTASFDPDGMQILAAYDDGSVRLWPVDDPQQVVLLGGAARHTQKVYDAAFSPDGRRILTVSQDRRALLWPGSGTGKPRVLFEPSVSNEWIEHGVWAPDGRAFCTASSSSRVRVWSTCSLSEPKTTLRHVSDLAHIGSIARPVFSADGRRLVTGGSVDAMIRVWRLDKSQRPLELTTGGIVTAVDLSPDGSWVLGAIESGTVKVWPIKWQEVIQSLRARTTATLTTEQRMSLLNETQSHARKNYEKQERTMGRTPLPADWVFQHPF